MIIEVSLSSYQLKKIDGAVYQYCLDQTLVDDNLICQEEKAGLLAPLRYLRHTE